MGKLPEKILDNIKSFNLEQSKDGKSVYERLKNQSDKFIAFDNRMNAFLKSDLLSASEDIVFHTLAVSRMGMKTLNFRMIEESMRYTGLHLDRSEDKKLGKCYTAQQRICFNLGETRYLYYCPISADKLKEILEKKVSHEVDFDNVIELYYEHFKKCPINVIELPFGHFYIAPTDNVIHDGSTINHINPDITLVYLGHFKLNTNDKIYELQ